MTESFVARHVAIIMDGNGRWALKRGMQRVAGHLEGARRAREIIRAGVEFKLEVLSLFAFSIENWHRPEAEVNFLWQQIFTKSFDRELHFLMENGVQVRIIGEFSRLSESQRSQLKEIEELTAGNSKLKLVIALSYSGRWDIFQACQGFMRDSEKKLMKEGDLNNYLSTSGLPDPDLLIRTGGEHRLSNFMLWQLAYTELYFIKEFWPDFSVAAFQEILLDYSKRERRFGRC